MYTKKRKLKRLIINVYHALSIDKLRMCIGGFDKQIDKAIEKFGKDSKLSSSELKSDIKRCYYKYLTTPDEYFLYGFEGKDHDYKNSFLSDNLKVRYLLKTISEKQYVNDLCDKYNFYLITSKYFKREVIKIGGKRTISLPDFYKFVSIHKKLFVKPISSTWGQGAHVLKIDSNTKIDDLYHQYSKSEWIIEDLIKQSEETSKWNPSSVNTVRLPCLMSNGNFHILNPYFRTGRKGKVIDNGGGGGIFASIAEESGIVSTDGMDEKNNIYECHPDSNIKFKGWQVPLWNELVQLAEEIFRTCLPYHKYIGFDFALTDYGWVLIEGNWGQFLGQYVTKRGIKQDFIKYIK